MPKREASKMSTPVKLTLSISSDLRARMAAFDDAVNWSEMARELFERRVKAMEKGKAQKLPPQAMARLAASEERAEDEDDVRGRKAGRQWAEKEAEFAELRRLERWHREGDGFVREPGDELLEAIAPKGDLERSKRADFWKRWWCAADDPSFEFVEGFMLGAVEVFRAYHEARV